MLAHSVLCYAVLLLLLFSVPWSVSPTGSKASLTTLSAAARGAGQYGLKIVAADANPIVLVGPAITLGAGEQASPGSTLFGY